VARDHRYRLPFLPEFAGLRVLDVGTFDGFYAFLAEHRGAARVVAVDNEQYVAWVRDRWGVELHGGEGFRAIAGLLGSRVEYVRGDALELVDTGERFDVILCFGILHRIENPLGLLRLLGRLLAPGGRLLAETYGIAGDGRDASGMAVYPPGAVYPDDDYVYWGFSGDALDGLAAHAGFAGVTVHATPVIDGHPRILATLERPALDQAASDGAASRSM
jgi:SAM-dependent methyltransferase